MAHFAQLDENNVVMQVIVVNNAELLDESGQESEAKGIAFCQSVFGADTIWKQTSYNANFRNMFAPVGAIYKPELDVFIPPRPFDSWSFNQDTMSWEAPIPCPGDVKNYQWNEAEQTWEAAVSLLELFKLLSEEDAP